METFDEKMVNASPNMLLVGMVGTFIATGVVESLHYSMDLFVYAGVIFQWLIGISIAALIQLIRFSLAMSAAKAFSMKNYWSGSFGLFGSTILTIMGLWEVKGLSIIWGAGDEVRAFGILLVLRFLVSCGLFLEVRYAILFKDMHKI